MISSRRLSPKQQLPQDNEYIGLTNRGNGMKVVFRRLSIYALAPTFLLSLLLSAMLLVPAKALGQQYQALYSFCSQGSCLDGNQPRAGVIRDAAGNLYGTTFSGGSNGSGTVFKVDAAGTETVLHSFCEAAGCADGNYPSAGLVRDAAGNLYGTTSTGGANKGGTVFKVDTDGNETVVYSFCEATECTDGSNPGGRLLLDASGNLYGTTTNGGTHLFGTVFKVDSTGKETVLYSFCAAFPCADGRLPLAGLVSDTAGNLYGTTSQGGANLYGTVFKLDSAGNETALYSFCSAANCADGILPSGDLILDAAGNLYGTTSDDLSGHSVLFKVDKTGTETVLHTFCSVANCADGDLPMGNLLQDTDGNLYGVTEKGGAERAGTLYKVDPAGNETVIYSFCQSTGAGACINGSSPSGGLIQDASGNIYGTASSGGAKGAGAVFSLSGATAGPPVPPALQFRPVTPCRIADTRNPTGPFGGPEMTAGSNRSFDIPQSACGIPSSAVAYSLNVTVVPDKSLGYLTLWPSGDTQPFVSTLNSDGRVKANAAVVPAGTNGAVSVFVSDATHVILDIDGYFVPTGTSSALAFYPLSPCRIVDTRNSAGALAGPYISGGNSRNFPVLSGNCNIPSSAQAYSLNVTAIPHKALNYLTVWPTGETRPVVSTLNASTGAVTANAAIVPAGSGGDISVFVFDDADVLLDVNGYFAPPASGGLSLYAVSPCRLLDTRPTAFNAVLNVNIEGSPCAPSTTAQAYVLNATVVPPGPLNYLTLWPEGETQPYVSTLNAADGAVTSNMAIVPTGNGSIDAFAFDSTNLILDISGYFAP
jgi:uncharacterized repeat protein (TIGR03803 family)